MPDPIPTTDTGSMKIKIPPWGYGLIAVAGVGIAYLYKKNQEKKESYFSPTPASQNRTPEPGFGGSSGGIPPTGLLEPTPSKQEPFSFSLLPLTPPPNPVVGPPAVFASPSEEQLKYPGLTPNQINALEKGYPAVVAQNPQPFSYTPTPPAPTYYQNEAIITPPVSGPPIVTSNYPQEQYRGEAPTVVNPGGSPQPTGEYPGATSLIESIFGPGPAGEARHRQYVKEHSGPA